jgi:alpha-beta hydrolase superfamily lysophospholipase
MVAGVVLTFVAVLVLGQRKRPELDPWLRYVPKAEFRAGSSIRDLAAYRANEDALFAEIDRALAPSRAAMEPWNRYHRAATKEIQDRTGGNRTFEIDVPNPRGVAVLFHGLSDSPYSVQPLGRILAASGYRVVGVRLPGHGTLPGALTAIDWHDWRAAAEVAIRDAASHGGKDTPLILGGYSNGAAVALDYTLRSLDDASLPRPKKLIFMSPAVAVSPAAAFAPLLTAASRIPGLEKLAWTDIAPEYDPFKYNSFTVNSGAQIHGITTELESELAALEKANRLAEIPPVLTIQSVVDSTIPPIPSLTRLYGRLRGAGNELVLFDINRESTTLAMVRPGADALLHLDRKASEIPFTVTLVTNAGPESRDVVARTRRPGGSAPEEVPLGLSWPRGVYSLSHVSIPFPPDDPVYGADITRGPALGQLEVRGEPSELRVSPSLLLRLRYNPFFPYLAERVTRFVQ